MPFIFLRLRLSGLNRERRGRHGFEPLARRVRLTMPTLKMCLQNSRFSSQKWLEEASLNFELRGVCVCACVRHIRRFVGPKPILS